MCFQHKKHCQIFGNLKKNIYLCIVSRNSAKEGGLTLEDSEIRPYVKNIRDHLQFFFHQKKNFLKMNDIYWKKDRWE